MVDLVLKDLAIVAAAARRLGITMKGTSLAEGYFRAVKSGEQDGGKLGTQAMAKIMEELGEFKF